MKLWDFLTEQIKGVTTRPTGLWVPDANVDPPDRSGVNLVAEEYYLRIWLREMCLRNDRLWFTTRLPIVHSVTVLRYGDQTQELPAIAGKSSLDVTQAKLSNSIQLSTALTGLLPFRGGSVSVDCGLSSAEASDMLDTFTNVVSTFASQLAQPQIAATVQMAAAVVDGVQGLLGAGKSEPKLYYRNTFAAGGGADALRSGFVFLSAHAEGSIPREQVFVRDGRILMGASRDAAKPPEPHDYMLIEMAAVRERDDWAKLTAIDAPFQEAIAAQLEGDPERAKQRFNQARIAAFRSPDLTALDRKRVLQALTHQFSQGLENAAVPGVSALAVAMDSAPSSDEARWLPDLKDEEIIAR